MLLHPWVCSVHTQSRSVFCAYTEVLYIHLLHVDWQPRVSHSALVKYLISHMLQCVQKYIHKHKPLPSMDPRISEDRLSWPLPPYTLHGFYRLSTLVQNTPVLQRPTCWSIGNIQVIYFSLLPSGSIHHMLTQNLTSVLRSEDTEWWVLSKGGVSTF